MEKVLSFEEFCESMKAKVEADLGEKLVSREVAPMGRASYTGLHKMGVNNGAAAVVNLNDAYAAYKEETTTIEDLVAQTEKIFSAPIPETLTHFAEMFENYDEIRDMLSVRFYNVSAFKEKPEALTMPYVGDIVIAFAINFPGMDSNGFTLVKKDMVDLWGVTMEQLYNDAVLFGSRTAQITAFPIQNLFTGEDAGLDDADSLIVVTDKNDMHGAAVVLYPQFRDVLKGKYYVIPSSVHEFIFINLKGSQCTDPDYIREMIRNVNDTEVQPEDRLSYELYYYDSEVGSLSLAE